LVKKGEITVEQGKQLNTELKRKAQEHASGDEHDGGEHAAQA
jgi:polyhydroxyalkanoate synthesis regulator phasin